jgi:Protein of unknown function (DUF3866)
VVITWRKGTVIATRREWHGAVELDVDVSGGPVRALCYPGLTGRPAAGDQVLLNTTALDLGLGTGGYALVVAVPDRLPPDPDLPGHLVKARYTPLQATVLGADEQGSPHHDGRQDADDIEGMPVVVADLHSALPAVLTGIFHSIERPGDHEPASSAPTAAGGPVLAPPRTPPARVVYVMQDGGALPAWFSRSCSTLREAGWLAGVVTTGQAFGGDLETVTLHTGLLAARHVLGADIAIVTQGPGNLGTGTRWGFSGVSAGEALRVSDADPRERHRGISHHSLTAYGRVALARADVVLPGGLGGLGDKIAAEASPLAGRHTLVTVPIEGLAEALRATPVRLSTMGRGLDEDLPYFLTAAAAGRWAGRLLAEASPA